MENKPVSNELFRLIVDAGESHSKIDYSTPSLWMGSCFTENIGSYLKWLKLPAWVNPFGVLYNPESIRRSLGILIEGRLFGTGDLRQGNDLWYSFNHHTSYSNPDRDECLRNINNSIREASARLKDAGFLFLTFGTARVYRFRETGQIVSNCHKLPHRLFDHELLTTDEITGSYEALIKDLHDFNPGLQLVFTISPVRHWKDGPNGNLVSKSTLAVAIASLAERFENVSYFPAYEIVMDELRDYRFYESDMIHINSQGVDYIRKRFIEHFIAKHALPYIKEITSIHQGIRHRPFNPHTESYIVFLRGLLDRIEKFAGAVPEADMKPEKEEIIRRLGIYG